MRTAEVARVAGAKALIARAGDLRPSLAHPKVGELGHRLRSACGVACYASVEDSMVLLGPPRSGKGVHIVINAILDAPGAVITTSGWKQRSRVRLRWARVAGAHRR